ncbi:muramoyltetrapeptide carboxypeptidase [Advenella incenata]|uniref:Muramoyltetrapeptide carboxypeptidase n=1 Tax=Advenella incenata TaxID=267800 RepID=A0A4Q7VR99_9BURK|nr:LD-carboxypeptidase [Advenella incenata]RZT99031.1 muramoyltetrapeptide carboxypeptidase [Advenella incenata]
MDDKKIALISPSSPADTDLLQQSVRFIESYGHRVIQSPKFNLRNWYCAGTVENRIQDLLWAINEADCDVIWIARGGYGLLQCLDHLSDIPMTEKIVIGSSDSTILLEALYRTGSRKLIHGPMVEKLSAYNDIQSQKYVMDIISKDFLIPVRKFVPANALAIRDHVIEGSVAGGNLTVMASLCGTKFQFDGTDKILFLEDVKEPLYRLDRVIHQLYFSNVMSGVKAIVLGEFMDCSFSGDEEQKVELLVAKLLEPLSIPVFFGAEFGHGPHNLAWKYGAKATLRNGNLTYMNTKL